MERISLWRATAGESNFPTLSQPLETEVAIIGGGITGITAAQLLTKSGKRVVVIEAGQVGQGTTGHSTGNLYATTDNLLSSIRHKWNRTTATAVAKSRHQTLNLIDNTVKEYDLTCNFKSCSHYLFPTDSSQSAKMEQERLVLREAGIDATIVHDVPLPFPVGQALKIENQAQFHPLAYVIGLAKAIASEKCRIFENTKALDIDDERGLVTTTHGKVRAEKIIMATHTPKGFNILQTELGPYREYGLAALLKDDLYPEEGIFWTLAEPSHSIRSFEIDGQKYLIVIGEHHKTGQPDKRHDYFVKVESFTRLHFAVDRIVYTWSGQHYKPADELPYIGRAFGSKNVYLATGFGTNGLVYGPLAASIIADELLGRQNPWKELYDAKRFTPAKSAGDFLMENLNVAKQYARDYLMPKEFGNLQEVKPGEGMLVKVEGDKLAAFRDSDNQLTALSPFCTHLGCIVHWNRLEESWDCPCHGSRFQKDGEVIEGPAFAALEKKNI